MNNGELSYKLKYILRELGMNKTEFLKACQVYSPSISKPTILNAINGKNTIAPTIETLSTIIKVCKTSGNEKLQGISYDFLLNDNIKELEAKNIEVYQELGLGDEVIKRLKQLNHPLYFDLGNIINYYFIYTSAKYWKYLEILKISGDIKAKLKKIRKNGNDSRTIKEMLKLWNNDSYLEYIERNFKNIYDLYVNIRNQAKESLEITQVERLEEHMTILMNHLKYLLLEMNRKLYETMSDE